MYGALWIQKTEERREKREDRRERGERIEERRVKRDRKLTLDLPRRSKSPLFQQSHQSFGSVPDITLYANSLFSHSHNVTESWTTSRWPCQYGIKGTRCKKRLRELCHYRMRLVPNMPHRLLPMGKRMAVSGWSRTKAGDSRAAPKRQVLLALYRMPNFFVAM